MMSISAYTALILHFTTFLYLLLRTGSSCAYLLYSKRSTYLAVFSYMFLFVMCPYLDFRSQSLTAIIGGEPNVCWKLIQSAGPSSPFSRHSQSSPGVAFTDKLRDVFDCANACCPYFYSVGCTEASCPAKIDDAV